jgi:hypothetical protein
MKLPIALLLFVSASLYANERTGYIRALPKEQIIATIVHQQELTKDAIAKKDATEEQNEFLSGKLVTIQQEQEQARALAAQAEKDTEALRVWGNEQARISTKMQEERDAAKKLAAHRGTLLGWICAAAGAFAGMSLMRIIPPPYNLAAVPLLAGGAFTFGRYLL